MPYKRILIPEFGGRNVLSLKEEARLPQPRDNEVRVKVLASGVAFTDVMIRKGKYPELKEKPPFSPGYDMVGIVDVTGSSVKEFEVGEMVADLTVTGSNAEYICLSADRLVRVPPESDPIKATALILSYTTAYQLLHRVARVSAGSRILVHGAGGAVGTAFLELARLHDIEVYGTASKPKHKIISARGGIPIDYHRKDFVGEIQSLKNPGVNAVFDPIGGPHLARSFRVVRKNGILVAYGFHDAVQGKGGNILMDFLRLKAWDWLPNGKSTAFYSIGATRKKHPDWFKEDMEALFQLLADGKIEPVIDSTIGLHDVPQAHRRIEAGESIGKIVIKFNT